MYKEDDNLNREAIEKYMRMDPKEREALLLKLEQEALRKMNKKKRHP